MFDTIKQTPHNKTTFIYGLIDPNTRQVRYVGKTTQPKQRLAQHIKDKTHCHRVSWINSLKDGGFEPEMIVLEEIQDDRWQDAEKKWIAYYKSIGTDLTNSTDGGEGFVNLSPECREKIRKQITGKKRSDEFRQACRARVSGENHPNYGKHRSPETRAKIGAAVAGERNYSYGKHRSDQLRRKISLAMFGDKNVNYGKNLSAEHRAKLSVAKLGKTHPRGRSKIMLSEIEKIENERDYLFYPPIYRPIGLHAPLIA